MGWQSLLTHGSLFELCGVSSSDLDSLEVKLSWAAPGSDSPDGGFADDYRCASAYGRLVEGPSSPVRKRITAADIEASMERVSASVRPWESGSFGLVKRLQDAAMNNGHVDLMQSEGENGCQVAVKRMPNSWVTPGPKEFRERHPEAAEMPWFDLGLLRQLNSVAFPYACELLGVFSDDESTYVMTSLATRGDLFSWFGTQPRPGRDREAGMLPIAAQMISAVSWLHELGVAHRDLSLENVLLTEDDSGEVRVRLIDFGMSTTARMCQSQPLGKAVYIAPEVYLQREYDAFLADAFALGVVLFTMAAQDYPWTTTRQDACRFFEYVSVFGFMKFLGKRRLRKGNGEHLSDVFSPYLAELLEGLLEPSPERRFGLGESCFGREGGRRSAWTSRWLRCFDGPHAKGKDRLGGA